MPVYRFRGFSTGTPVPVSDSNGARYDRGAALALGVPQATLITLSLEVTRLSGTAPMGVIFMAMANSPAARAVSPFHDIEYVWSFDDPGKFSALDNAPIWGTDRNIAYGPLATHVFEAPGTYMVTCTAHDGENPPKSEIITIEVAAANDVFTGQSTAVVSTAGNFAGAPAGAREFTSTSAAVSAMQVYQNYRILLRRGESYDNPIAINAASGSDRRILIGSFGNKADGNPLLDMSSRASGEGEYGIRFNVAEGVASELMVANIDYLGHYDPSSTSSPEAADGGLLDFTGVNTPITAHKTVWGCHIKNSGGMAMNISRQAGISNIYVGNCFIDGWNDYGFLLSEGGYFGLSGCAVRQPRGTRNGGGKANTRWADHGPFRASRPTGPCIFSNCDMTSFNSWNSSPSNYSMQPVIRWDAGVEDYRGDSPNKMPALVIDRLRCEGPIVQPHSINGTARRNRKVIIDRVYMIFTSHQTAPTGHGGTTWRNGIFVIPNARSMGSTGINDAAGCIRDMHPWEPDLSNANADRIEFYSNIVADMRSDENSQNRAQTSGARKFVMPSTSVVDSFFGNNIGYAPNRVSVSPVTDYHPLDVSPGLFEPLFDGERFEATALDTQSATPPTDICSYRPLSGSSSIGGATGKVSLIDFDGKLRSEVLASLSRSTPSIGAYEPDLEN